MSEPNQPAPESSLDLHAQIEAILFIAPEPISIGQLARTLETTNYQIETGLEELEQIYDNRGICIQRHQGLVRMTTVPEAAAIIEHFLGLESTSQLSRAALEALSIVAYQQPVTRPYVDSIRGVNSDSVIKTLLSKGLIQEVGRAESPGRPILYSTTPEFLGYFGLRSLEELPALNLEEILQNQQENNNETPILKE